MLPLTSLLFVLFSPSGFLQNLFPTPSFALCFRSPFLRSNSRFENKFYQELFFKMFSRALNRAYAGLRHAIVIAPKPHFLVTSSLNKKARLGGDNKGVT